MIFRAGGIKDKTGARNLDRRVRERNLANGTIEQKQVDRYLSDLPDLEHGTESLVIEQPALAESTRG